MLCNTDVSYILRSIFRHRNNIFNISFIQKPYSVLSSVLFSQSKQPRNIQKSSFFFYHGGSSENRQTQRQIAQNPPPPKKRLILKNRDTAYSKSQFHFFLFFFFAEKQFLWYYILRGVGAPEASKHKGNLKDDLYDISALLA